ncbi:poly polymerase polyadp-ribose synthetase [Trichoderma arundinaceum]|uniref:Poly [ADP-ribose] polymerase n=1 Tax=Trichoderma arundinaceum TaxID=490622 RepID=A0A395NAT1_TRIAR|nr:poly polymerase polyadp-ribose synthetase [Trichoderma arundinaceum]
MPRRRVAPVAPAAPAAPSVAPLDGCVIAISGRLDKFKHTQASLERLIGLLGGSVTKSVAKTTTHVICSEDSYNNNTAKVAAGKAMDLPLVSPDWIFKANTEKKTIDPQTYVWGSDKPTDSQMNGMKAPIMVSKSDKDKKHEAKTNGYTGAKGANDKAKARNPRLTTKIKKENQNAEGQFIKRKGVAIPVDEHCPLTHATVYIDPDSGLIYDASLNQTNASNNNNKFYRVQILFNGKSNEYKTWTRWGRVGEIGRGAILGNGTVADAIKLFEKKFKDKSSLTWDNRGDNPKPGKYAFVERSYNPDSEDKGDSKDVVEKGDGKGVKSAECTLQNEVKSLMELIFNQQYFQDTMTALNYDTNKLPLGKLSKATIIQGFRHLKDLADLLKDNSLAKSKWNKTVDNATEMLSNLYYSIIPHAFGRNRPPVIRGKAALAKEIELLESLSDMKVAAEIMKIDCKSTDNIHPLDKQFQSLGLNEITVLDRDSEEFKCLSNYLHGSRGESHGHKYKVRQIFRIERQGENIRFNEYVKKSRIGANRRLLWHGSRATNFGGTLSQGLRIAPPEAPASGYMFGKGIYLADMSSKSANYCRSDTSGGQALLLLCEAKLGHPIQLLKRPNYNAGSSAKRKGMESTLGMGEVAPSEWEDAGVVHESLKGVQIPNILQGPCRTDEVTVLKYNEYVCYDIAQVKLRYLFHIQM